MKGAYKYESFWEDRLPLILEKIRMAFETRNTQEIILRSADFEKLGNRPKSGYTFRMDIPNGIVPTKGGSSVARDLKRVLDNSAAFRQMAADKDMVIRMGKDFVLHVEPII